MSQFIVTIECDNAAFSPDYSAEIARILRQIATKVEGSIDYGVVNDANGNRVAKFEYEP